MRGSFLHHDDVLTTAFCSRTYSPVTGVTSKPRCCPENVVSEEVFMLFSGSSNSRVLRLIRSFVGSVFTSCDFRLKFVPVSLLPSCWDGGVLTGCDREHGTVSG